MNIIYSSILGGDENQINKNKFIYKIYNLQT